MSVESRKPHLKNMLRVGAAAVAITSIVGCGAGESKTPTPTNNASVTVTDNHTYVKKETPSHRYSITLLSADGTIFLVNPLAGSSNPKEIDIAEGIIFMRKTGGCDIVSVKPANAGDIIQVANPRTCLPQLK